MKSVDEALLERDPVARFEWVAAFIGFDAADQAALLATAPLIAPLVPQLVDAVYERLFSWGNTKRHFLPRQSGYTGSIPTDLASLQPGHEMIQFRKRHLAGYLAALVTRNYDTSMVNYLDHVGAIHTPKAGSPALSVPLVQINALLGFVADAVIQTILSLNLEREVEVRTLRAFNKLLRIQSVLISRHYEGCDRAQTLTSQG
ncbi:MAG TPA: hypothetical protein DIT89_08840 [Planctomycetaceae bacterium]|nr:hypothetical protein [Planctomycetaceae bacterium]